MANKLYYKIGEACKELDIQPYVLRYWETEFQALSPRKSKSGQRVYSAEDLELIRRIKELLYEEGYTIAGAKKKLESEAVSRPRPVEVVDGEAESEEPEPDAVEDDTQEAVEEPELPARPAAPKKRARKAAKPKAVPSAQDKTVAKLQRGIREALKEAKEILELLDSA